VLWDPVVRQIAASRSATPAQVALHWLIRQPQVITIPKSSNHEHLQENLGAIDLELSQEDLRKLNQLAR
jgi:diketogulonate reductase-like aldo/keto reductase